MPTSQTDRYHYSVSYLRVFNGGTVPGHTILELREPIVDNLDLSRVIAELESEPGVRAEDEIQVTGISLLAVPKRG